MTVFRDATFLAAGPQVNAVVRRGRFFVRVDGYRRTWKATDLARLSDLLSWRDNRGGAEIWLSPDGEEFPALALRISGDVADVHYFPDDGHTGFRCLGGNGLPVGGMTRLDYQGADPEAGEYTPNEFVVPVEVAHEIAVEFFCSQQMSAAASWFEL